MVNTVGVISPTPPTRHCNLGAGHSVITSVTSKIKFLLFKKTIVYHFNFHRLPEQLINHSKNNKGITASARLSEIVPLLLISMEQQLSRLIVEFEAAIFFRRACYLLPVGNSPFSKNDREFIGTQEQVRKEARQFSLNDAWILIKHHITALIRIIRCLSLEGASYNFMYALVESIALRMFYRCSAINDECSTLEMYLHPFACCFCYLLK